MGRGYRVWKKKLQNEEFNNLYSSANTIFMIKSRILKEAVYVARMGERKVAYRILMGSPEGKRPLGKPRRGWKDKVKMDFHEV